MARFSVLIFAALLSTAKALRWDGAKQSLSATNTANWSPAPTDDRTDREELKLRLRNIYPVALCGWINGDGGQGAYCSPDSSCAWNTDIGRVGCCATVNNACTFYTDCTTAASLGPDGVIGNIYTCVSGSTCYQNTYDGGYLQYGCGTLKGYHGTTVATSYPDENTAEPNPLQIIYVGNSAAATSLAAVTTTTSEETPTSLSTEAASTLVAATESSSIATSTESSTESSSTSSPKTTVSSSQISSSPSTATTTIISTPSPSTPSSPTHSTPIGAIIGGAVGGFAILALLIALCLIGRRKGWFSKSSHSSPPIGEIAYPNDIPPRYQTHIPSETKAELASPDIGYGGVRQVSMLNSERSFGRSELSPTTSPRFDDASTFGGISEDPRASGLILVNDDYTRSRMGGGEGKAPIYEVP